MIQKDFIMAIISGIWLLLCSWQDIRKKRIHIILIGAGCITILLGSFLTGEISIWSRLAGLSLGILLLILNKISRGQIGTGDGLIVSIIGAGMGFNHIAFILAYGLFGSAVFSIGLILFHKAGRKVTIPFIPFVFLGYLGVLFK